MARGDLNDLVSQYRGQFGCILADPPWAFRDRLTMAETKRGAQANYPTMTLEEICAMGESIRELVKADAHLYLWTPCSLMLTHAPAIFDAWGFTHKTNVIWVKTTKNGKQHFGMGNYFRASHEEVLFGTRGKCPAKVRNIRSVFSAVAGRHSAKPEELHDIAEQLSPGPYLELFARRAERQGWTFWGNEI